MHSLGKRFLTRSSLPALLLGGLLLLPGLSRAATPDPVFDLEKLLATPLNPRTTKTTEQEGVITEEDWPELKENIRFDFRADNFFTELKESEILAGRIDILNSITPYVGTYFSQNWVRRHVLRMTDEDIEDMAEEMTEDAEIQAEQMMQNPQLDKQSGVEDISANETFDRST